MDYGNQIDYNLKSILKGLAGLLIFAFVIVHIFLLIEYGTPFPCESAAHRLVSAEYGNNQSLARAMTENMVLRMKYAQTRQQSIGSCYAVALKMK